MSKAGRKGPMSEERRAELAAKKAARQADREQDQVARKGGFKVRPRTLAEDTGDLAAEGSDEGGVKRRMIFGNRPTPMSQEEIWAKQDADRIEAERVAREQATLLGNQTAMANVAEAEARNRTILEQQAAEELKKKTLLGG